MIPSYRFGVSEFTTTPWTFEQDVEQYSRLGVDAIEVCEFKLDEQRMGEQLALIAQHGLTISSVQPKIRTLFPSQSQPEPSDPRERMALFSPDHPALWLAGAGTCRLSPTLADHRRATSSRSLMWLPRSIGSLLTRRPVSGRASR